ATRSSSRMATIVSWPLEEMIISLVMRNAPVAQPPDPVVGRGDDGNRRDRRDRRAHGGACSANSADAAVDRRLRGSQLVNLRMRTLSTSPKPASVAIIDDPP